MKCQLLKQLGPGNQNQGSFDARGNYYAAEVPLLNFSYHKIERWTRKNIIFKQVVLYI